MSPVSIGILGIVIFFILLFTGVPIAFSLGISGFTGLWLLMGFDKAVSLVATMSYSTVSTFTFAVIPLFILMGMLVSHTGMSTGIYNALAAWLNRVPAGMGVATIWSCAAFGTLNGSAGVTASVFARASAPELIKRGYDKELTYGMIAAAGSIGQFIPPSILIVVYGALSGDSIGRLLMAGISPGIALGVVCTLIMIGYAILRPDLVPPSEESFTMAQRFKELLNLVPVLFVGGLIVYGLASGSYSSTEAGAVGAFVFLLYAFVKRVPIKQISVAFVETAKISCMTFIILTCASFFSRLITMSGLSGVLSSLVSNSSLNSITFMLLVLLIYIIMGCFLDSNSCLCISLPLFLPVADVLGIDRIHFAMVVILALHIGGITPPVGMNAFFVKSVAGDEISLQGIFKGCVPFLIGLIVLTIIYIFIPSLSTALPNYIYS